MAIPVVLLVLLALTNAVTIALLVRRRRAAALWVTRPIITVEVLNPIEVAAARGRLVGVAGALAPGLVTRIVHDRTVRTLRRELTAQGVEAEVRLHTVAGATITGAIGQAEAD